MTPKTCQVISTMTHQLWKKVNFKLLKRKAKNKNLPDHSASTRGKTYNQTAESSQPAI